MNHAAEEPAARRRTPFVPAALLIPLLFSACATLWKAPPPAKPPVVCRYTASPIQIDGAMDKAWDHAVPITDFTIPGQPDEPVTSRTEARMLWDENCLYVFYKAWDKDIWGYFRERDDPTCREDVLELFIKPDPEGEGYCNFEINALGTIYDAWVAREKTPMGHRWQHWNCPRIRAAVHVEGTLNDFSDQDAWWSLELAIPFDSLPWPQAGPPDPGVEWLFHLGRYDYSVYLETGRELTSCAALVTPTFHKPAEWRRLRFEK